MKWIKIAALIALCVPASGQDAEGRPLITASRTAQPPVIDGRVSVFLEIINIYDRESVRDVLPGDRRRVEDGELIATNTTTEEWFPPRLHMLRR